MAQRRKSPAKKSESPPSTLSAPQTVNVAAVERGVPQADVNVFLQRESPVHTSDKALWVAIRNRSKAIGFPEYEKFVDRLLCEDGEGLDYESDDCSSKHTKRLGRLSQRTPALRGLEAYEVLKKATEAFLLVHCGVRIDGALYPPDPDDPSADPDVSSEEAQRLRTFPQPLTLDGLKSELEAYLGSASGKLPYLDRIIQNVFKDQDAIDSPYCFGVLRSAAECPCLIELIWSYWHEEGMLVQSLNKIALRFQNKLGSGRRSPLAALAADPLRPLNNLLWGYIQDESHRLTVSRRAYEYDHEYGLTLLGKAVPKLRSADSRSKFLEAFHTLLHRAWAFYLEDADTTVIANGFPLLNSLREVHMLLAEGAHNQFGDLPWTARVEMLIQMWLMARPEIQDFLRGRAMVPYKESWMGQVDTMKKLQGWTDVGVTHFRDLAVFGEQILLSVRYADWISDTVTEENAKSWSIYWKPEIQGYIHAYRAATGVDLTSPDRIDFKMPAVHLSRRLPAAAKAR